MISVFSRGRNHSPAEVAPNMYFFEQQSASYSVKRFAMAPMPRLECSQISIYDTNEQLRENAPQAYVDLSSMQ